MRWTLERILGAMLVLAAAGSAAAQAPAEPAPAEQTPADPGDPPAEHPGAVFGDEPVPPAGYQDPSEPAPQDPGGSVPTVEQPPAYGQQPGPQPGYGQQPGYGPQAGYGYRPTYHRERYVEGMQLPPNAQIETRVRKGMIAGGIAMFLGGYLTMVFTYTFATAFGDPPGTMLIPAIGPFFVMPDASSDGRVLLGIDALLQFGGLTMLVLGATLRRKYVTWYGDSNLQVTPTASRGGGGMQLSLSF